MECLYTKNDKVIGVLGGSCNVTALSHMLFDDLFDGAGNSFLVTSDGERSLHLTVDLLPVRRLRMEPIFLSIMERKISEEKHTLQDMQVDFKRVTMDW